MECCMGRLVAYAVNSFDTLMNQYANYLCNVPHDNWHIRKLVY